MCTCLCECVYVCMFVCVHGCMSGRLRRPLYNARSRNKSYHFDKTRVDTSVRGRVVECVEGSGRVSGKSPLTSETFVVFPVRYVS